MDHALRDGDSTELYSVRQLEWLRSGKGCKPGCTIREQALDHEHAAERGGKTADWATASVKWRF
jgi:hypothetical protein